jgi:hypothetical protein
MTARKILLATFALALFTTVAEARPRPGGRIGGRRFDANKTFGLGLELGAPTGLNGKYFLQSDRALNFGLGTIYNYFDRYGFHLYGDYLFHPVSLVSAEAFELPLYVGVGLRLWDFEDRRVEPDDEAFAIGVRVPIGIAFDFNTVPLDIFVQLVFIDIEPSFGIRYWFN